jgi:hypothetical protein
MDTFKFWGSLLFMCSAGLLANNLAFAAHDCSRQVVNADGTIDITTDCSSSYSTSALPVSETLQNQYLYSTLAENLQDSITQGLQISSEGPASPTLSQGQLDQAAADSQQKEQQAIEEEQTRQQDQEARAENSRP